MHDTIVIEAANFADAESQVYRDRPVPKPGFEACAKPIYTDGYYDIEYLGELVSNQKH